jgi:hypothetical protein
LNSDWYCSASAVRSRLSESHSAETRLPLEIDPWCLPISPQVSDAGSQTRDIAVDLPGCL